MSDSPVTQMLGVSNVGNPFEVLGLEMVLVSEADIIDALGRRMTEVAKHPLGETPEGNEVRLALHAATAQLLDPGIRNALLARAGIVTTPAHPRPIEAARPRDLGPRAMMVIAAEGGWNARALRRLVVMAHAQGLPSSEIPAVIRSVLGAVPRPAAPAQAERQGRAPKLVSRESRTTSDGHIVVGAFVLLAIIAIGATWLSLNSSVKQGGPVAQTTQTEGEPEQPLQLEPETTASSDPAGSTEPVTGAALDEPDWVAALLGMRDAGDSADGESVLRVLIGISKSWDALNADELRRVASACIDIVYRLETTEAVSLVNSMAEQIRTGSPRTSAWFGGLLSRLSIERALDASVDNAVVGSMAVTLGNTTASGGRAFSGGVAGALQRIAGAWTQSPPDASTRQEWLAIHRTLSADDPDLERMVLRAAIADLVRRGQDPMTNAATFTAIERLTSALELPEDAQSAALIVSMLGDRTVSTRPISVVIGVLRQRPELLRFAGELELGPSSSDARRATVRDVLQGIWFKDGQPTWASGEYAALAERQLALDPGASVIEQLANTVALARLSEASGRLLWGDVQQAETVLGALRDDIDLVLRSTSGRPLTLGGSAGEAWAVRYLEAKRNIPVRTSLIAEVIDRNPKFGPIAAELLVGEALTGSPVRVRRDAQNAVLLLADQPSVVNAVLEQLPTAPRVQSVQKIVEAVARDALPSIGDEEWEYAARRAVAARLLSLIAVAGDGEKIDEFALLLERSYAGMLRSGRVTTAGGHSGISHPVQLLYDERQAELRRIDRTGAATRIADDRKQSLSGRVAMAEGVISWFAAYQVTAAELLGDITMLERPESAERVAEILSDMAEARRNAGTVFEQILGVERASVRLWLLRVGGVS